MRQVAKRASKVAEKGPRWTDFGTAVLTFEAVLGAFLHTFKRFFCLFVQNQ